MGIGGLDPWEVVLIFVVVLALFLAGQVHKRTAAAAESSPEEILRDRFERGEISEEELREMLQALRDSQAL